MPKNSRNAKEFCEEFYKKSDPQYRSLTLDVKMAVNEDATLSHDQEAQVIRTICETVDRTGEEGNLLAALQIAAYINSCK